MAKRKSYILYLVQNKVNGKMYFGITGKKLRARWSNHLAAARAGQQQVLYRAIRKYGPEAFEIRIVARSNSRETIELFEQGFIEAFDTHFKTGGDGYNMTDGGDGVPGLTHAPDVCQRLSEIAKRRLADPANRAKAAAASALGRTPEHNERRRRLGLARKGTPQFAEWCQRRREQVSRPVVQMTRDGEIVAEFASALDAKKATGISNSGISAVCWKKPRRLTAGGYCWKFREAA